MRSRLGWALLLLAAVFAMHGLQCMAAEPVQGTALDHGVVAMDMATADGHASGAPTAQVDAGRAGHAVGGEAPAGTPRRCTRSWSAWRSSRAGSAWRWPPSRSGWPAAAPGRRCDA